MILKSFKLLKNEKKKWKIIKKIKKSKNKNIISSKKILIQSNLQCIKHCSKKKKKYDKYKFYKIILIVIFMITMMNKE